MNAKEKEKMESMEILKQYIKPGDTIYTTLYHVSRSGMFRTIGLCVMKDNEPINLTWHAGKVAGYTISNKHAGVAVSGCGMDMGFSLVYNLSAALYPDGFECIGEKCPSNDHSNGDRNREPHHHSSGGYALRHRWL
jgi:hypothetical protein